MDSVISAAMAAPVESGFASLVRRLSLALALSVSIALPAAFFYLSYSDLTNHVETLAKVKAGELDDLAGGNPDLWQYNFVRIAETLQRGPFVLAGERATVRDMAGNVLFEMGECPEAPVLTRSFPIHDFGRAVGRVDITHSYRKVVVSTLLAALLGLLLGAAVYAVSILPLRALRRTSTALAAEQTALRASEEHSRALFYRASDGIMTMTTGGKLAAVNESFARMHGYSMDEMINMDLKDLDTPATSRLAPDRMQRILAGESMTFEVEHYHKDGHAFPLEVSASLIRSEGEVVIQSFLRDMTERARTEKALHDAEARYRTLFEQSPDGIVIMDPETTRPLEFNETAHSQLGYSREEFARLRISDIELVESPEEVARHVAKVLSEGRDDFETQHRTRQGEIRHVRVTAQIIQVMGRPVYHCIWRDITERKRAEDSVRDTSEQLRQLAARLNNIREAESSLLSRELHDEFGQMLTRLKMDISLIDSRLGEADPALKQKVASSLAFIDESVKSLQRIAARLRPRILDELGLLPALDWLVQDFRERTGIDAEFVANALENGLTPEQATAVFRIAQESLNNIVRHAKAKSVDCSLGSENGWLTLEIRDDGEGLGEDKMTGYESIGLLGMRERALAVGGELVLESVAARGTIVTLRLPLATGKA